MKGEPDESKRRLKRNAERGEFHPRDDQKVDGAGDISIRFGVGKEGFGVVKEWFEFVAISCEFFGNEALLLTVDVHCSRYAELLLAPPLECDSSLLSFFWHFIARALRL